MAMVAAFAGEVQRGLHNLVGRSPCLPSATGGRAGRSRRRDRGAAHVASLGARHGSSVLRPWRRHARSRRRRAPAARSPTCWPRCATSRSVTSSSTRSTASVALLAYATRRRRRRPRVRRARVRRRRQAAGAARRADGVETAVQPGPRVGRRLDRLGGAIGARDQVARQKGLKDLAEELLRSTRSARWTAGSRSRVTVRGGASSRPRSSTS